MHKDAARQRKHLCLVLHAAEGRREDQAVIVALKLGAVVMAQAVTFLLPKPFVRYELVPFNGGKVNKKMRNDP